MVWDGEGCNDADGTMSYVLLGHTSGITGDPVCITDRKLSTHECLSFIWEEWKDNPNYIHVSFGFSFDVDQILRDFPTEQLQTLKQTNELAHEGWKIKYIPRKFFSLAKGRQRGITIFDTISFFHGSLINVCKQYVPDNPLIAKVSEGKDQRDSFNFSELDSLIIPYWVMEGELMVALMNALRKSLTGAGITLTSWHGPGAIAEALLKREGIARHIQESRIESPVEVIDATAFAYFGGRFECNVIGDIPGPIYSYDIRSAYPAALSQCPALMGGHWQHWGENPKPSVWGLYRVTNHGKPGVTNTGLGPLPNRDEQGRVSFSLTGSGWYYGHEVVAAQMTGWLIEIHEGWTYENAEHSAFTFLHEMYLQRADYKRAGNPAELACKLGLNSIYGKLAQLTGWDEETGMPPKYHNQWYAGQTTSWCRARLWLAMSQAPQHIIAVETDGIYSTAPLKLELGYHLGQWEAETYDRMVYVQSGMYFAKGDDRWIKARTRGLSGGIVSVHDAIRALPSLSDIPTVSHRYGSMAGYLGREKHWKWFDQESTVQWGGGGKRYHEPGHCPRCIAGASWPYPHETHRTIMTQPHSGMSSPRKLPWLDTLPDDWTDDDDLLD
jgi:hypothetical protein